MKVQNINNYTQTTKNPTMQSRKNLSFGSIEISELEKVLGSTNYGFFTKLEIHINSLIEAVKNYKIETIINKAKKIRTNILEFTDSDGQKLSKGEIKTLKTNLTAFITSIREQLSKNTEFKFIDAKTFIKEDGSGKTTLSLQPYTKEIQTEREGESGSMLYSINSSDGLLLDEVPVDGAPLSQKISLAIEDKEILGGKKELKKGYIDGGYGPDDCEITEIDDKPGIFVSKDNSSHCGGCVESLRTLFLLLNPDTTKYEEAKLDKIIKTAKLSKAVVGRLEKEKAAANAEIEAKKLRVEGIFD